MEDSSLNILIITDDPIVGSLLDTALHEAGHQTELKSGARALEADLPPCQMAFVDARRDSNLLRRAAKSLPHVVAIGERGRADEILEALRSGADDYLPRQFRADELEGVLARLTLGKEASAALLEYEGLGGELLRASLHGKAFSLGRDPSNHLCLESPVVSRFHAQILRKGEDFVILDRESRHGVFVNGERVGEKALRDGDEIRLGSSAAPTLIFRLPKEPEDSRKDSPSGMGSVSSRELKDISNLLDTFLTLNSDLLLEDLLEIVISRSMELAQAERGMILLADGEDPKGLRLAMARDHLGSPLGEEGLHISRKIPEEVMATGKGIILDDLLAPEAAHVHPATIEIGVRSAMCVPLKARRGAGGSTTSPQMLGVLYVDSSSGARPFFPRVLHAFESLASEAAQAILNARLYEVSLEKRQLDEEMRIAHDIQKNLLPPSSFENRWMSLHGTSEPSREVGGDFLNYYSFSEERTGLVVGDVSGKGIPAAIFSSMLDGLCYGLGSHSDRPARLGEAAAELNRYLVKKSRLQKFVSIFFGVLSENGSLWYVNAGHNPPLWIDQEGKVELLRTGGVIMGMFEDAEYSTGSIELKSGGVLVLFSDGITEGQAPNGERFGLERLRETARDKRGLAPQEIHEALTRALSGFVKNAPPSDDVTLMVVKYRGTGSG